MKGDESSGWPDDSFELIWRIKNPVRVADKPAVARCRRGERMRGACERNGDRYGHRRRCDPGSNAVYPAA